MNSTTQQSNNNDTKRKPRLIISKLRMENFKSYAGIQEIGPFHKSFTAIIGPNGSGKSNVIDAMLFVFGRRANQIRLKKLSDLIHSSSTSNNLPSCSVEVHFAYILDDEKDKDAYTVVPNSTFYVKRSVTRNNASQYYINDKPTHVNDVIKKLKDDCQIDLDHNRFLILQGEVEQIATMKPKAPPGSNETGLLEYLEDIIGSSSYKAAIDQQQEITEELTQLRQEKLIQQEMFKRVLTQSGDRVSQRIEFSEKSIQYSNSQYLYNYLKMHRFLYKYHDGINAFITLSQQTGDLTLEIKKLSKQRTKAEASNRADIEAHRQADLELKATSTRFQEFESKHAILEQQKAQLEQNRGQISIRADAARSQLKQLTTQNKEEVSRLPKLDEDIDKKTQEVEKLQTALDEKVQVVSQLTEPYKLELQKIQNDPLQQELDTAIQTKRVAEGEYQLIENKLKKGLQGKRDIEQDITNTKDMISRLQLEITDVEEKKKQLLIERSTYQNDTKQAVQRAKEISDSMLQTQSSIQQLQIKISNLHANNNLDDEFNTSIQQQQQNGQSSVNLSKLMVHQRLLEQKIQYNNNRFKDVYGRVADICWIDQRYECALANACPDAQHVVVLNSSTAQNCVHFLREKNYGRASFLPLDASSVMNAKRRMQQELQQLNSSQLPPNCTYLFHLIQFPTDLPPDLLDGIKAVLYKSIGDTIVCPDVQTASNVAFGSGGKSRRTVSITGELMQTTGAMSGGRVKRNIFITNERDCYERRYPAVFSKTGGGGNNQNQIANAKKKQEEDNKADELRRIEEEKLQKEINQYQLTLQSLQQENAIAQRKKTDTLQSLQQLGQQVVAVERQLTDLLNSLDNEKDALKTHENLLQHNQQQEQRQKQDQVLLIEKKKQLEEAKTKVNELEQQCNSLEERKQQLLSKILKSGGAEVSQMKQTITKLNTSIEELGATKREIERNIAGFQNKVDQRKRQIDSFEAEINSFTTQINDIDEKSERLIEEAEALLNKQNELQSKLSQLDEKVKQVKQHTHQLSLVIDEKTKEFDELESQRIDATQFLELCVDEITKQRKMLRKCVKNAKEDFANLIDTEAPPNPLDVASYVHEQRRKDFISRYIKQQEKEKKQRELDEQENMGSTTTTKQQRGRKKATTTTTTKSKQQQQQQQQHDTSSDDDDDSDDVNNRNDEIDQWTLEGNTLFLQQYPQPVPNEEFNQLYQRAIEESKRNIYTRLPWYGPTWEIIATLFNSRNIFAYRDNVSYHKDLDDIEIPDFIPFTYSSKIIKRSEYEKENGQSKIDMKMGDGDGDNNNNNNNNQTNSMNDDDEQIKTENNDDNDNDDEDEVVPNNRRRGGKKGTTTTTTTTTTKGKRGKNNNNNNDDNNNPEDELIFIFEHNLDKLQLPPRIDKQSIISYTKSLEVETQQLAETVQSIGEVEAEAVQEHQKNRIQAAGLAQYLDIISDEREVEKLKYEELKKKRTDQFMKGLHQISNQLKMLYRMLTMGGDAELELSDQNDPFLDGITFSVRPPKKSWKQIQNLSGGEKTLSSLSLVFSLHYYKPTPLYVMDEIDAALDYKNVSIVANYIRERTNNNAQFIIISLRNNMFELSNRLVGIYKTNDRTKTVTIDPREYIKNQLMQRHHQQQLQYQQQQQQQQQQSKSQTQIEIE